MRTTIYVDGFNFYYRALKGTPHKWLNLDTLFHLLLRPPHAITAIKYFTARVSARPNDPGQPVRQDMYLRALRTVPDEPAVQEGAYYLNPTFEQLLASFNTAGDRPYNPNAQLADASGAQPFITGPTLDGFPVRWVPALPAYSTSVNAAKVFALFGALEFQYLGVRGGIRFDTSLEGAFATDEILIRALERFTIGLMANGAAGGLQTAAS